MARIALAGQVGAGLFTRVDDTDLLLVESFTWLATRKAGGLIYAIRWLKVGHGKWRPVYLHRLLVKPLKGQVVDHRNGDGLDNRRANLRLCSHRNNIRNAEKHRAASSKYKGVFFVRRKKPLSKPWRARIHTPAIVELGYFASEREAALAYDKAARRHFGLFARVNFPKTKREK